MHVGVVWDNVIKEFTSPSSFHLIQQEKSSFNIKISHAILVSHNKFLWGWRVWCQEACLISMNKEISEQNHLTSSLEKYKVKLNKLFKKFCEVTQILLSQYLVLITLSHTHTCTCTHTHTCTLTKNLGVWLWCSKRNLNGFVLILFSL